MMNINIQWQSFTDQVNQIRYDYTVKINQLFEDENIGWRLKKGKFERIGKSSRNRSYPED